MNNTLLQFINTLDTSMKRFQDLHSADFSSLTIHQLQYLQAIVSLGSPTISEIAAHMGFSKPSVTEAIKKLAALGFVIKERSKEDGRVVYVRLTQKSETIKSNQQATLAHYENFIRESLTEDEREQFEHILQKLVHAFAHNEYPGEQP